MREMTMAEMLAVRARAKWATIVSASPEGLPYAIEATPYMDDGDVCFMINPRGGTWNNVRNNPEVLLKYTLASGNLSWWAGVSCYGRGLFDPNPEAIRRGFALLGEVMGADYSRAGERFAGTPERSPLLRVRLTRMTGRCSAAVGAVLPGLNEREEPAEHEEPSKREEQADRTEGEAVDVA